MAAGDAAFEEGRLEDARRHYEKAAATARERSERAEEILALNQLGILAERQGALEDAADHYRRSLNLQRVVGEGLDESVLRTNLSRALRRLGDYDGAQREALRAIDLSRPDREPATAAAAFRENGRLLRELGRRDEACAALALAAELFSRAAWHAEELSTRLELGRTMLDNDDARHAVAELSRAAAGAERVTALRWLADAFDALDQPQNAITFRERAIELGRGASDVELQRALLEEGIAAATRLERADLAAAWRNEHDRLAAAR